MLKSIFNLAVVFFVMYPIFSAQNVRKYNVEEEAFKLYKQDFKSVLKRFRRTTDYLKILEDKLLDLKISTREMSLQVLHFFHSKMEKKVTDTLPPQAGGVMKVGANEKAYFRSNTNKETPPPHISEEDWKKISELDRYNFFYSHLTIAERNTLKEMGFSYAGQVIHSIISNLKVKSTNPEDEKFTKLPFGGDIINKFTTAHPEHHQWKYVIDSTQHREPQPLEKGATRSNTAHETVKLRASEDFPMYMNQTIVKLKSAPENSSRSITPKATKITYSWVQPTYGGFSEPPTMSTKEVVTSVITFEGN